MNPRDSCVELLCGLYEAALSRGESAYLRAHSRHNSVRRHVEAFLHYRPHLPDGGVFLDWGCRYAVDACLIRHQLGPGVELRGCDVHRVEGFAPFHEYASVRFSQLDHHSRLPYEDETFDAVIGSGVLEHVRMEAESLKELYRVLKNRGVLILTFLPNRYSYTEWCCRRLGLSHHERLYTVRGIRRTLMHHGFAPLRARHHQFVPAQRGEILFRHLYRLNGALESVWPTSLLCANIMVVGGKQ